MKMKTLTPLIVLLVLISCSPKELPTVLENTDSRVVMKVSHMTTRAELDDLSAKLAQTGITVDYSGSEFFDNGRLRRLVLMVVTPEGNNGRTTADIVALQFRYFGFEYIKGKNGRFKIGEVN